jgi:hypothetical protein
MFYVSNLSQYFQYLLKVTVNGARAISVISGGNREE